jgi:DNA-binding NarL/FixJ family response regulator
MPIEILIVDDHPIMRVGIATMIEKYQELKVVGLAGSGEDAVRQYAQLHPDIVLLDLRLPGISGLTTLKSIRASDPEAHIVILTTYDGDEDIHRSMKAGARGYLTKGLPPETLLAAIHKVHAGGLYIPAPISKSLARRTADTCLSSRECEVLQLLAEGKSNKQIAQDLGIRESTVKCHISVILTRLDANDRTQAVINGQNRGFLHPSNPA